MINKDKDFCCDVENHERIQWMWNDAWMWLQKV